MKQVVYKFLLIIYVMLLVFITYINNGVNNVVVLSIMKLLLVV